MPPLSVGYDDCKVTKTNLATYVLVQALVAQHAVEALHEHATAPEVLSRSFAALASFDVKVKGAAITLGDLTSLRKLVQPSPTIDDPGSWQR